MTKCWRSSWRVCYQWGFTIIFLVTRVNWQQIYLAISECNEDITLDENIKKKNSHDIYEKKKIVKGKGTCLLSI